MVLIIHFIWALITLVSEWILVEFKLNQLLWDNFY